MIGFCTRKPQTPLTGSRSRGQQGWQWLRLVQAVVLFLVGTATVQAAIPSSERAVLLNLYTYTLGPNWAVRTGWGGPPGTECGWFGITCDASGQTVTGINLAGNFLYGLLPPLSDLPNLETVNVASTQHAINTLFGTIPSLTGLTKLQTFIATAQQFTGSIPALSGLSNLVYFDVSTNQLSGDIPDLTGLSKLQYFDVSYNLLTGIQGLAGLTHLQHFDASVNLLKGDIPPLNGLSNLDYFDVSYNELAGNMPALTGLTNVKYFSTSINQLTGNISLLSGLTNLQNFDVQFNHLTGSIPDLSSLTGLTFFAVDYNQLTGAVPNPPPQIASVSAGLCPNELTPASIPPSSIDLAWNTATQRDPWSAACTQVPAVTAIWERLNTYPNDLVIGVPVTVTAFLYGNNPTGTITFTSNNTVLCDSVLVVASIANCTITTFAVNSSNTIDATYSGDANNAPTSTTGGEIVIQNVFDRLTAAVSENPVQVNQPVDLEATLVGAGPGGNVAFYDGITPLCSNAALHAVQSQYVAHCVTTFTTLGDHLIKADYVINGRTDTRSVPIIETVVQATAFDADQHGLTGSWYNPATGGQGFEIEVYPDLNGPGQGLLFAGWFTYDVTAAGGRRWYGLTGNVSSANPAATLQIFDEEGGNFNAPPSLDATGALGEATMQFSDCNTGSLTYNFTDGSGRSGIIPLSRLTPNVSCSPSGDNGSAPSDYLLSGNWYNPNTSGQGLIFDFSPAINNVFAAWYTFLPNGQQIGGAESQDWFTLQSAQFVDGSTSLENISIIETTGGVFNSPTPAISVQVGTANIAFQNCNAMTLSYKFTRGDDSNLSGTINLQRVGPTPAGCSLE